MQRTLFNEMPKSVRYDQSKMLEKCMDITEVRRNNLQKFIKDKFKTRKEFAVQVGKSYSQVMSWFVSGKSQKNIGEKLARDLEEALELPENWLDREHSHDPVEAKFITALESIGYEVKKNNESFAYNELNFTPEFIVSNDYDYFFVSTMTTPFFNNKLIRIASGLNLTHYISKESNKVIVLLCDDDLYFAKDGDFKEVLVKRLQQARQASPYDVSDFMIPFGEEKTEIKPMNIWGKVQQLWSNISNESKHNDSIIAAKHLLEMNGFNVIEAPASSAGRLMVLNKSLWSMPSLIIYLPKISQSFYIDLYPEKRLGIIPALPENKYKEILFVKQKEVIDVVAMVRDHIDKWFPLAK